MSKYELDATEAAMVEFTKAVAALEKLDADGKAMVQELSLINQFLREARVMLVRAGNLPESVPIIGGRR